MKNWHLAKAKYHRFAKGEEQRERERKGTKEARATKRDGAKPIINEWLYFVFVIPNNVLNAHRLNQRKISLHQNPQFSNCNRQFSGVIIKSAQDIVSIFNGYFFSRYFTHVRSISGPPSLSQPMRFLYPFPLDQFVRMLYELKLKKGWKISGNIAKYFKHFMQNIG